jgi:hypothetical protein
MWGDKEGISGGASLFDVDIYNGEPASLMSAVSGLQDVKFATHLRRRIKQRMRGVVCLLPHASSIFVVTFQL